MVLRRKLTVLLMPVMVLMLAATLLGAHKALAEVFNGTPGDDTLIGTALNDTLYGYEGNDYLDGRAGDDRLDAGAGVTNTIKGGRGIDRIYTRNLSPLRSDECPPEGEAGGEGGNYVYAGAGNDLIYAREEAYSYDRIDCGAGFDRVETLHSQDVTLKNCERALGPSRGEIPD
jgi:Ca2+-binding RTX toxin-like protein